MTRSDVQRFDRLAASRIARVVVAMLIGMTGLGCGPGTDASMGMTERRIPPLTEDFGDYFVVLDGTPGTPATSAMDAAGLSVALYSNGARASVLVEPGRSVATVPPVRFVGKVIDASTIDIEGGEVDVRADGTFLNDPLVSADGTLIRDRDGVELVSGPDGISIGGPRPLHYWLGSRLGAGEPSMMPTGLLHGSNATWADEFLGIGFGGIG